METLHFFISAHTVLSMCFSSCVALFLLNLILKKALGVIHHGLILAGGDPLNQFYSLEGIETTLCGASKSNSGV